GSAVPAGELVRDHVADVVPVARVLAAGIAEADDEQVERRGAFAPPPRQAHGLSLDGAFAARCGRLGLRGRALRALLGRHSLERALLALGEHLGGLLDAGG